MVANALSRRNNYIDDKQGTESKKVGILNVVTRVVSAWYKKIYDSYKNDIILHEIMANKMIDANKYPFYTHVKGIIKYKERIVVGDKGALSEYLVKFAHNSFIEGHVRIHNSYKRLKAHLYWPSMKKLVKKLV